MYRLVLRNLSRPTFSSIKSITGSRTEPVTQQERSKKMIEKQTIEYKSFLEEANREIAQNLSEDEKITLIHVYSHEKIFQLRKFSGIALTLVGLYQMFAGSYNYYCITGTLVLAAIAQFKLANPELNKNHAFVSQINLLKDGNIEVFVNQGSQVQRKVVTRKDFAFGGRGESTDNCHQCTIGGKQYNIPPNSYINSYKLNEI